MPPTTAELRTLVRDRLTELARSVDGTARDAAFTEALRNMARFWRYSVLNQVFIHIQRPEATRVAGRLTWEAMGRRVKPGEAPVLVLAPSRYRGGAARFVPVPVYDVRQTRGRKVAELDVALRDRSRHWRTLERAAANLQIEVAYVSLPQGLRGLSRGDRIEILPGLPGRERTAVLAHELGHEVLHQTERRRRAALKRPGPVRTHAELETEAEATAFVLLSIFGLPSKAPTYIAWQGGSGQAVLRSMNRVQRAVKAILEASAKPHRSRGP